jgi:phosphoribosylanthranilate isomerase
VLAGAPTGVRRVGVFGAATPDEIAEVVETVPLDVVQLHADPTVRDVDEVRARTGAVVWAVLRVRGDEVPPAAGDLFAAADGLVLDALAPGGLGGTGVALPWARLTERFGAMRGEGRGLLVLAGGLRPGNVTEAIRLLSPDVVDVSSGVESAPGIKDHDQLAAFAAAVRAPASTR